jgi:hypothetical protein
VVAIDARGRSDPDGGTALNPDSPDPGRQRALSATTRDEVPELRDCSAKVRSSLFYFLPASATAKL